MIDREPPLRPSARRQKGATMMDVASLAGVSPMTVSRVINDETSVRPVTREAVKAAIERLNYAPNPAARSLAAGKVLRIGLLYANPSSAYLSAFLVGGLDQCHAEHIHLMVEACRPRRERAAARTLIASGVSGVILPPPLCDLEPLIETLRKAAIPAVGVATGRARPELSTIRIDDFAAAGRMTDHLLHLGHRRIGFIAGDPIQTASGERLRGYQAALARAGLAADADLMMQGAFTFRSGFEAAERLLNLPKPPSAIFAANDDMAAAVVAAAHRRGIDVPGRLSVCGFDDSASATNVWPELTTIRQPIADMARRAVSVLLAQIRDVRADVPAHDVLLPYRLVRRASDGAPPG